MWKVGSFGALTRKFSNGASKLFTLEYALEGQTALLKINNPAKRNALSKELLLDMNEALTAVSDNKQVRSAILMSSAPGMFCAGADLKERLSYTDQQTEETVKGLRKTFHRVYKLAVPTIACMDGAALGGGLELALANDLRVATKTTKIGLPEVGLAILPGAGGTQRLARVVGLAKAKELVLTGRVLTAEEALAIGLINYSAEDYELAYSKCIDLAKEINKKGPLGVRWAKEAVNGSLDMGIEDGLQLEEKCYHQIVATKDRKEGLHAFVEKRKPVYKGE